MKESDIRPQNLLTEYLRLSAKDTETYFSDKSLRQAVPCPACGDEHSVAEFDKHGFSYVSCVNCHSLYLSPRPTLAAFEQFYVDSPSSNYWADVFFPHVAEARRDHIFKPRVMQIADYFSQRATKIDSVMDVGAGYGIFLQEWKKHHPEHHVCAVEPGSKLAQECRNKDIETLEALAENASQWAGKSDLVTCFEVIEHAHTPLAFIAALKLLSKPGGHVLISGLGVDGFDIQTLWQKSNSISPPHHINFMSVEGFKALFEAAGFEDVDVISPGKLDVDITVKALNNDPELAQQHRFASLLARKGQQTLQDFQQFLQQHQLSSHVWVIAKNPE